MSDPTSDAAPFDLLGHEVRVRILTALVRQRASDPTDPGLAFGDLRERVGVSDSGRFNYHLGKLVGRFVHATDDGYQLSAAGTKVAGALLSGDLEVEGEWGPTTLESPCRECGEPVAAAYEDGMIRVECERGHLNHRDYFPASVVRRTSLPEAVALATLMGQQDVELLLRDVCPNCHGEAHARIEVADAPTLEAACDRCGHYLRGPPGLAVLPHPVLRGFYLERGRDLRTTPLWTLGFLTDPDRTRLESEDPLRVGVAAAVDGDEASFLLEESCSVVAYDVG